MLNLSVSLRSTRPGCGTQHPQRFACVLLASAQPAPAGVKTFIQKYWKPIIAVVCAAVVAAAVLVPKNSAKPAAASAQYVETRPEKRNIVNSYSADGTITYPVTIRIDDTGSLMPGMNATAALDIPPCRRYVIVKATAGFAVFRLILKSLLFYSCLDFTQNLGKTHFCLTFGVHFSIRSLFFGIFFNVFAIGIYSFDSCFLSTTWIS